MVMVQRRVVVSGVSGNTGPWILISWMIIIRIMDMLNGLPLASSIIARWCQVPKVSQELEVPNDDD